MRARPRAKVGAKVEAKWEESWWCGCGEKKSVRKEYSEEALSRRARLKFWKASSRLWGVLDSSARWEGRAEWVGAFSMSMRRPRESASWDFWAGCAVLRVRTG